MTTSDKKMSRKEEHTETPTKIRMSKDDTMARIMDKIVQSNMDLTKIRRILSKEATKRGVKVPTIGMLRSHVRYRQARGHLSDVQFPKANN